MPFGSRQLAGRLMQHPEAALAQRPSGRDPGPELIADDRQQQRQVFPVRADHDRLAGRRRVRGDRGRGQCQLLHGSAGRLLVRQPEFRHRLDVRADARRVRPDRGDAALGG
jgi:hypothetical protein